MICIYLGARGRGKTLTMVKDAFKFYHQGYKILRNFETIIGEYISNEKILEIDKDSNIRDCVLLIDEIQIFFDSRRSSKRENVKFSNFIQQVRKRNLIILCTTQYKGTIDLRLRQHLDYEAFPNYIQKYKVCEVTYRDLSTIEQDVITGILQQPKSVKIVFNAEPIFKLYDTNYIIA